MSRAGHNAIGDENWNDWNPDRPTHDIRVARPQEAAENRWGDEYRPNWNERPRTIAQWNERNRWNHSQWQNGERRQ